MMEIKALEQWDSLYSDVHETRQMMLRNISENPPFRVLYLFNQL